MTGKCGSDSWSTIHCPTLYLSANHQTSTEKWHWCWQSLKHITLRCKVNHKLSQSASTSAGTQELRQHHVVNFHKYDKNRLCLNERKCHWNWDAGYAGAQPAPVNPRYRLPHFSVAHQNPRICLWHRQQSAVIRDPIHGVLCLSASESALPVHGVVLPADGRICSAIFSLSMSASTSAFRESCRPRHREDYQRAKSWWHPSMTQVPANQQEYRCILNRQRILFSQQTGIHSLYLSASKISYRTRRPQQVISLEFNLRQPQWVSAGIGDVLISLLASMTLQRVPANHWSFYCSCGWVPQRRRRGYT